MVRQTRKKERKTESEVKEQAALSIYMNPTGKH